MHFSSPGCRNLRKEMKTRRTVRPKNCYVRFKDEGAVVEKHGRTEGAKSVQWTGGGYQRPGSAQCPVLGIRIFLSSGYREGTSHMSVSEPVWGNKGGRR